MKIIQSRRRFIAGAAVVLATPYVLDSAFATMTAPIRYNPVDFGPIGSGDDTPAIQGAINASRTYSGGRGVVECDSRNYAVGAIDYTGINFGTFEGNNSWFYGCNQTVAAPVFDMTSSNGCRISGVMPIGQAFQTAARPPITPLCAILVAESIAKNDCNANRFEGCGSAGWFHSGALSIIGAPDNEFRSCRFQQWDATSPCLTISTQPDWWVSSIYKTITNGLWTPTGGNTSVGAQVFDGCEFHGPFIDAAPANWTTYMRNADNILFNGGNHAASGSRGHMLFQGTNNRITINAVKFYADTGVAPINVFEGTATNLCLTNAGIDAYSGRVLLSGSFPGYRSL